MNTLNSFKTHVFYYDLYDQSDEFNVIGQQVSYCRRPRAIYGMLHSGWAITNTCIIIVLDLHNYRA